MSRIFISHSSANNAAALALSQWLDQEGWSDHFLDIDANRGLSPGQRWQAALAASVDRCEAVIFLISPAWRDSAWCLAEFHQAKSLGKPIFGVLVEPTPIASLRPEMTTEWQLCNLIDGPERVSFSVNKPPIVSSSLVDFSSDGLNRLRIGLNRAGLDPSTFPWPPAHEPDRAPYPGLRALDSEDAAVFFGRDADIVRAMDRLRLIRERGVERLFIILGASGAGKSSFLRAGLLPRIARDREHFLVLPLIRPERAAMTGTYGFITCLQQAFEHARIPLSRAELRAYLASARGLATIVQSLVSARGSLAVPDASAERTVVLPIDQGEELFVADDGVEAHDLLELIAALDRELQADTGVRAEQPRPRLLVMLAVRSDTIESVQVQPALSQLAPVLFSLPPVSPSEYKAVVEGPARRHSESGQRLIINPELSLQLIHDTQGADALPQLALTLELLYREYCSAQDTVIGETQYEQLGGVRGAIEVAVRRALSRPEYPPAIPPDPADQQRSLRQIFPLLATVDPDTGETKRRVARLSELPPDSLPFIARLEQQRLLLRDRRRLDDATGETTVVEVAHEALLRQWDVMRGWLAEHADALKALEALRRAATEWDRRGRDAVWLVHTGYRLEAAQGLLDDPQLKNRLSGLEVSYVAAARKLVVDRLEEREQQLSAIAEQQRARAQLQRKAIWGLAVAACVVLGMLIVVIAQTRDVARQSSLVLTDAGERADNEHLFDRGLRFGVLSARQSWLYPGHPSASAQLARAADGSRLLVKLPGHHSIVHAGSFSPDGKRVVTASDAGSALVWDVETGKRIGEPLKIGSRFTSVSFSPDGKRLVTVELYLTSPSQGDLESRFLAKSWNAETGEKLGDSMDVGEPMESYSNEKCTVSFSPDSRRVVTAAGRTVQVWVVETGKALGEAIKYDHPVILASFSTDGKQLFIISRDGSMHIWDVETGMPQGTPIKYAGGVTASAFSPDRKRLATAFGDGSTHVRDVPTGKPIMEPIQQDYSAEHVNFSPDAGRLVTVSRLGTLHVWNAEAAKPVSEVILHQDARQAAGGPTGLGSAKPVSEGIWHEDEIYHVSFSADGKRVVTVDGGNTARIWDAEAGTPVGEAITLDGYIVAPSFSADGKRVVTAAGDGTVRIWDAETGTPTAGIIQEAGVNDADFSPDSKRVVIGSFKGFRIWDAEAGTPVSELIANSSEGERIDTNVKYVSYSPNGRLLLTVTGPILLWGGIDSARVWDAKTGQPVGEAIEHPGGITAIRFSPDGKRVMSIADGILRVWEAAAAKPRSKEAMLDHAGNADFSPDGKRVVTSPLDKTVQVWDVETGKRVGQPLKNAGKILAVRFSPDGKRVVTLSADGAVRVWEAAWSTMIGSMVLIEMVCSKKLVGAARFLTDEDIEAAPILAGRVGEDVCAGINSR
jgi:WD40 repeat protein